MPPEAKIFLSEDDPNLRKVTKRGLEFEGHRVVVEAHDLKTALDGVETARELGVNVAVLDGNLTPRDVSCRDGRMVASALRAAIPGIRIVAFSGSISADYGDVLVDKNDWEDCMDKLIEAVSSQ